MDAQRLARTTKGQEEIVHGRKSLKGKLRTVLFLVDANKNTDEIQRQIQLIGAPEDSLAQLMSAGYVAPADESANLPDQPAQAVGLDAIAQFRLAKAFMNDTIVDALGIRAFVFTLRLERCATVADLVVLLPDYSQALAKKLDRQAARALVERTRELLSVGVG